MRTKKSPWQPEVSVDIWKIAVEELEVKEQPEGQAKKD